MKYLPVFIFALAMMSLIGGTTSGLKDLSFLASVPEPGSILLLLVASMSFVVVRGERPNTLRDSCG